MLIFLATALAFETATPGDLLPDPREDLAPPELDAPIVNGEPEPEFSQTVGLEFGPFFVCSASAITPRILLTAAHCVEDITPELFAEYGWVIPGQDKDADETRLSLVDAKVHPRYKPLKNGLTLGKFDLAVLVLEEPLGVDPIWFNEHPLGDEQIGAELLSVGYGTDDGINGTGSGIRRSAELVAGDIDAMFVYTYNDDTPAGANICSGDSGGPQYHLDAQTGRWVQWAVHSWGDESCTTESGSTRTDRAADWILETVQEVHGTDDRCAINDRYADGQCDTFCGNHDIDCGVPASRDLSADVLAEETPGGCATAPVGGSLAGLLLVLLGLRREF